MASRLGRKVLLLGVLAACSDHKSNAPQIFYGECQVEVVSKTKGAEIMVDGVLAGEDHVKVKIPCGEKYIQVVKHGLLPYEEFLPVSKDEPLKVTVELEHLKHTPDFALSKELLAQARAGKRIRNPWLEEAVASEAPEPEEAPVKNAASVESKGAAVPSAPGAFSTNVEDWR